MGTKIIIIGGGAAGLMAAKELTVKGIDVLLVEANERLGGRINTLTDPAFDTVIEAGAEFVHGNLPITMQLLKEGNILFHAISEENFFVKNAEWLSSEDPIPHWDTLMKKMKDIQIDITIADFLEQYFSEEKYWLLKNNVRRYAEGFDLADIHTASTIALRNEWAQEEEEQYRIDGGYDILIQYLANECKQKGAAIHTSSVVKKIEWINNKVKVFTDKDIFEGNKIIITVPVSILKKDDENGIRFDPVISEQKNAAAQIGYGTVIKIFLKFESSFWKEKADQLAFIISDQVVPTWWTQAPDNSCMLTGWLGGPNAKALMQAEESIILKLALESLANIFAMEIENIKAQLKAWKIVDWSQMPFSFGAYSFATTQTFEARSILKKDIEQTIFFAGESIYEGDSPGTVEAALTSGRDVAYNIIQIIQNK